MNPIARLIVVALAAVPLAILFVIDGLCRCAIILWQIARGPSASHTTRVPTRAGHVAESACIAHKMEGHTLH